MKTWQRRFKRSFTVLVRSILFLVILSIGTTTVMLMDETSGLALTDLSNASVRLIATSTEGKTLYAVLQGGLQADGIYRSEDNGHTWQRAGVGPDAAINALAIHPNSDDVIFAGTVGGPVITKNNLWRSDDGGQTWRKFFLSLPAHPDGNVPAVTALAISVDQPERLYVGTEGQGVYQFDVGADGQGYSLIGGVTFHSVNVKDLAIGASGEVYALTDDGVFVTHDNATWQTVTTPPEMLLDIAGAEAQSLYAMGYTGNLYRLNNDGENWQQVGGPWWSIPNASIRGTALTVDPQDSNHAVVSTAYEIDNRLVSGSLYETQDGGHNWAKVADAKGLSHQLLIGDGTVFSVTPDGLVEYGRSVPGSTGLLTNLRQFLPSYGQALVILLTTILASLILFGRMDWMPELRSSS